MDKYTALFTWLDSKNSYYPKLRLRDENGYRTVVSTGSIEKGEKIMSIPLELIIDYETALESPLNKKFKGIIDCEHTTFALYLLEEKEKGVSSQWWHYIDTLPKNFKNMALYFDNDLLKLLRGTLSLEKIIGRRSQLHRDYDSICMHDPEFSDRFTLDDFIWGRLVTITRIFGFSVKGHKTTGLVPLADMLNHKNPDKITGSTETTWDFDDSSNSFRIVSNRNIKPGKEIYDSYGFKCNSRFFVNYGFAVQDNEDDDETSVFGGTFHVPGFLKAAREGSEQTRNMFDHLRKKVLGAGGALDKWDREKKVLEILHSEIQRRISEFGGSQERYLELETQEKDFKKKCCYTICLSELKILKKFQKLCQYMIPILSEKKLKKIVDKKNRPVKSGSMLIDQYISSIL